MHLGIVKASSGLTSLAAHVGLLTFPCGKTLSSAEEFTLSDPIAFQTMRCQGHCEAEEMFNLFHKHSSLLKQLKGKKI